MGRTLLSDAVDFDPDPAGGRAERAQSRGRAALQRRVKAVPNFSRGARIQPTAQAVGREAADNKAPEGRKNRVGRTLLSDAFDFDRDFTEHEQDACSTVEERRFSAA